jgi:hypothetical protein
MGYLRRNIGGSSVEAILIGGAQEQGIYLGSKRCPVNSMLYADAIAAAVPVEQASDFH